MITNLAILTGTWSMISRKKLVALNVLIIVSKYTFLAMALYLTLKLPWIQPLALVGGVTLFVISTVMTGLIKMKTETQ